MTTTRIPQRPSDPAVIPHRFTTAQVSAALAIFAALDRPKRPPVKGGR